MDDGQPQRRVLPRRSSASARRDGGDPALRRLRRSIDGDVTIGVLVGFIAALNGFFDPIQQLSQLYTTYQSGMAALDKIFELLDERARPRRTRRTRSSSSAVRGEIRFDDVTFAYAHGDDGAAGARDVDARRPAGPDGRARRRDRRRQVDVRQARRALLRPDRGPRARRRPRPARRHAALAALAAGHRAAGGLPVQRHGRARTSRFGRPDATRDGDRRRGRARSAPTSSSPRCRTATTPRSASAACSSRPASASSSRSPARWSPTRASSILDEATSNVDIHTEARDRGGPAPPARRPHRDRHRPPPVDDPRGRPDRRARRTAASSSRARTTS